MDDVTDLRTLVERRLTDLGLSARAAAAKSGDKVSRGTIDAIRSGRHSGEHEDSTVEGLALALDVPRSTILRALNWQHEIGLPPFAAPGTWNRLQAPERKALRAVGDALLAAYDRGRQDASAEESPRLRAVASGQRGPEAQQEARAKARRARGKSEDDE